MRFSIGDFVWVSMIGSAKDSNNDLYGFIYGQIVGVTSKLYKIKYTDEYGRKFEAQVFPEEIISQNEMKKRKLQGAKK